MAIGLGRMFGFHFLENFNYPYFSRSISDFWRRWHISLGTWFRDYVYIPLGGNRVSTSRLYINLCVVWFLTGLWHGANWTFIIWGLLYLVLLCFEKKINIEKHTNIITHIYTLFFVIIGWVIFRSNSIENAWRYINTMLNIKKFEFTPLFLMYINEYKTWLIISMFLSIPYLPKLYKKYIKPINLLHTIVLLLLLILSATYIAKDSYNPFIYFNSNYTEDTYVIISSFVINTLPEHDNGNDIFDYHNYINFGEIRSYENFMEEITERSTIITGIDCNADDDYLTLSTCSTEWDDSRHVIVARKLRNGETKESIDTTNFSKNPNPKWPAIYYKYNGGTYIDD
jgi:hypothetical protein